MRKDHLKELGIIVLVFILSISILEIFLPKRYSPYVRIMTAEIKRDYPMYHILQSGDFEGIKPAESVYPMETLYALNFLMKNQMDVKLALTSLSNTIDNDGLLTKENEVDIRAKLMEFKQEYDFKVRFISVIFIVVMAVLASSIIFQILHMFDRRRLNH